MRWDRKWKILKSKGFSGMKAHPLMFYLGVCPQNSLITLAKKKNYERWRPEKKLHLLWEELARSGGYFPIIFRQFRREAAFRIFSHNFWTVPAGSGFEDIFFPQFSKNSGGKWYWGSFLQSCFPANLFTFVESVPGFSTSKFGSGTPF